MIFQIVGTSGATVFENLAYLKESLSGNHSLVTVGDALYCTECRELSVVEGI